MDATPRNTRSSFDAAPDRPRRVLTLLAPFVRRACAAMAVIAMLFTVFRIAGIGPGWVGSWHLDPRVLVGTSLSLSAGACYLLARRGRVELAFDLLNVVCLLHTAAFCLSSGLGVYAQGFSLFPVSIILVGLGYGGRGALLAAGGCILFLLAVFALQATGVLATPQIVAVSEHIPRSVVVGGYLSVYALVGTTTLWYANIVERALGSQRKAGRQLERSVAELQEAQRQLHEANGQLVERSGQAEAARDELARLNASLEFRVAERTEQLEGAAQLARAANFAKSAFLANMSHEIRTPLNAIIGMAHLLKRESLTPGQSTRLQKLETAANHLLGILNSVLDLSKIEAGRMVLENGPVDVQEIVDAVAAMVVEQARAKQLALRVEVAPLPPGLLGDRTRILQCLLNYAANAVKFTDTGSVSIRVHPASIDPQATVLRFEVEDTGIGIDEAVMPRLFASFEQTDVSMTRRYGGTGLGLALTRKFSELMGGGVGVASVAGEGSTFWFTVRLGREAGHDDTARPPPLADAREQLLAMAPSRRLLVVDDAELNLEITAEILRDVGFEVDVATNGADAIAAVAARRYDLVLMDMQMPEMDGLTATRRIRELPEGASVPILALTANTYAEDREKCAQAGMNDFISKPVDPPALYGILRDWLLPGSLRVRAIAAIGVRKVDWEESLSVGDEVLDAQHQRLLGLCNRLAECLEQPGEAGEETFHEILHQLIDYSREHFVTEETMLARIGYAELAAQRDEHAHYETYIVEAQVAAMNDALERVELQRFLSQWWTDHILVSDMQYRVSLAAARGGEQAS